MNLNFNGHEYEVHAEVGTTLAEALRDELFLTDILTTSAAVADYIGADTVAPNHVLMAVAVLNGERGMEDLGRARSPLVPRRPGSGAVEPALRELSRRWYEQLGSDVRATLTAAQLTEFVAEVEALASASDAPAGG